MNNVTSLSQLGATLIHNSIYLGISFVLILAATLGLMNAVQRCSNLFLRSKMLSVSAAAQEAWRRKLRRVSLLLIGTATLLLSTGTMIATWQQVRIGDFVRGGLQRMQGKDWLALGLAIVKTFGVLLLAFVLARLLVVVLHYLRERLQHAESLSGHRERLAELLTSLRLAMSCTLLFATILLCAQLLGLPDGVRRVLSTAAYIGCAIYIGRFAVGAVHLVIDVVFDLSDVFSRFENPLRYLGRFRHLSKLTKRTTDYFIYVGGATWVLDQITPGTWASQAGRLAIRIIAIFYVSRVLVEVCVLFMNEFFLTRDNKTEAEYQQRQTLVPVAAGLLRYGIYFTAIAMMLREAGIDPTPLLAGAGVVGVAIGLGAQAFVGDIVAGFFILFENLILVGDFVEIGGTKGKVEEIGVRVTRIRDESGVLHAIPNGEVRRVASHSRGYVNVVIDIPVPYEEDLHKIFDTLKKKTVEVRASEPAIMGLTDFALEDLREGAIVLRTTTMVKPGASSEMSSVLRLAFWEGLSQAGVTAPYARRMLLSPSPNREARAAGRPASSAGEGAQSDIQKVKAHNLFRAIDVDGNGFLERADIDALVRRIIENQRRPAGSDLHAALQRSYYAYWADLLRFTDGDKDARVSKEEFLQYSAKLAQTLEGAESIQAISDTLFTIADHDGRGTISTGEFLQWTRAYGVLDTVAASAFELLDSDKNGRIDHSEWSAFMRDVMQSTSINDAAALVFGPGCRGK